MDAGSRHAHEVLYRRLIASDVLFQQPDEASFERQARRLIAGTDADPTHAEFGRYWLALVSHVYRDVLSVEEVFRNEVVREQSFRMLAAAALVVFPAGGAPPPRGLPATVRRAIEYIDQHRDEAVGVTDIASAARLTVRGLQQAFKRHLGVTPTAYLRDRRLAAAHADLQAATSPGDTVEAIALRHGFSHLPRFAAAYRAVYGQTPSTTLRS